MTRLWCTWLSPGCCIGGVEMFLCNEPVTLIRHLREADGDRYLCVPVNGASWYAKTEVVKTEKGLTTGNVLKCRIPEENMPKGRAPAKGDYLVHGMVERVERLPDLKQYEHFVVTAVGDNRRGRFRHWLLTGS